MKFCDNTLVPIKVKNRNSVGMKDVKGLVNFCKEYQMHLW